MYETPQSADESVTTVDTVAAKTNQYIEIVEETDTFPWQYAMDGVQYATRFTLRLVPDSLDKKWRRELTSVKQERGQRVEKLDNDEYVKRVLAHGIVDWDVLKVTRIVGNERVSQNVPCELRYKLLLPERLKVQIIRVCVGKEAGLDLAAARDEEKNG